LKEHRFEIETLPPRRSFAYRCLRYPGRLLGGIFKLISFIPKPFWWALFSKKHRAKGIFLVIVELVVLATLMVFLARGVDYFTPGKNDTWFHDQVRLGYGQLITSWWRGAYVLQFWQHDRAEELAAVLTANKQSSKFMRSSMATWAIVDAAEEAGFDNDLTALLLTIASWESGLQANVRARTSSACGYFQFISATGQRIGMDWWQCMSPVGNSQAMMRIMRRYITYLPEGKHDFLSEDTMKTIYLIHHDGPKRRGKSDPNNVWPPKRQFFLTNTRRYFDILQARSIQ
jgi:hypothetical protein